MNEAEPAHEYPLEQVERLVELFKEARGRPARTLKEL
jgi:hypothetical protein